MKPNRGFLTDHNPELTEPSNEKRRNRRNSPIKKPARLQKSMAERSKMFAPLPDKSHIATLYKELLGIATRYVGSTDAEDAVQTSYQKFLENYSAEMLANSELRACLFTIVKNTALDFLRRSSREYVAATNRDELIVQHIIEDNVGEEQKAKLIIDDFKKTLSEEQRNLIDLKYFEGFRRTETAKVLRVVPQTVRNRLKEIFRLGRMRIKF